MTVASPRGYLNKKQIEATYGRSYRSLTRDITNAVKVGDTKILQYLKLVTEDGKLREGSDVTLDMIQELSNSGLRPMWLAEETWVADWVAKPKDRRGSVDANSQSPSEVQRPNAGPSSTTSPSQSITEDALQQRIEDLKQQNEMLRGQLQIKDDQIRSTTQLAEQSQQLMRDLHVLLKNVQDGLLGEGSRPLLAPRPAAPKSIETKPQQIKTAAPRTASRKSKSKISKPNTKTANAAKDAANETPGRLQRWLPTIFGQKRRGN